MPLFDPKFIKEKNRKRLICLKSVNFFIGINLTGPSKFKDSLRVISVYLLLSSLFTLYGKYEYIKRHIKELSLMSESICLFLQITIAFIKLAYIAVVQRRFYRVLSKVESYELINQLDLVSNETPYNKELRKEAIKALDFYWKLSEMQFRFFASSCFTISIFYIMNGMVPNAYHAIVKTANYTNQLTCPALFPFWEHRMNHFPEFFILALLTISAMSVAASGAVNYDGMFIYLALHGAALIRILKKSISMTTSPQVPKHLRIDYLRQCIQHYERTYEYCLEVDNLYLHTTLAQFVLGLVILGVVMFNLTVGLENSLVDTLRMIFYMAAAGYQVVLYCLNGQALTSESEGISDAWYGCEWYNESREFRRLILMMIMRSNRTIVLRASWFSSTSHQTLLNILRSSSSYFLLLRNFNV